MSENRTIGKDGDLPWHLPDDMKQFKNLTIGHTVIMGRKTWASLPVKLPDRTCIVLSRDPNFAPSDVQAAHSLDDALAMAQDDKIFVVGGAAVYKAALPMTDRMYLTIVHAVIEGDVRFPEYDESCWALAHEERHPVDERHAYPFSLRLYERVSHHD